MDKSSQDEVSLMASVTHFW